MTILDVTPYPQGIQILPAPFLSSSSPAQPSEAMPAQPAGGAAGQRLQSEPAGTEDSVPTAGFEPGSVSAHPSVTAVTQPGSASLKSYTL